MAHKLRARAGTGNSVIISQPWPPRHDSFMRWLGGRQFSTRLEIIDQWLEHRLVGFKLERDMLTVLGVFENLSMHHNAAGVSKGQFDKVIFKHRLEFGGPCKRPVHLLKVGDELLQRPRLEVERRSNLVASGANLEKGPVTRVVREALHGMHREKWIDLVGPKNDVHIGWRSSN